MVQEPGLFIWEDHTIMVEPCSLLAICFARKILQSWLIETTQSKRVGYVAQPNPSNIEKPLWARRFASFHNNQCSNRFGHICSVTRCCNFSDGTGIPPPSIVIMDNLRTRELQSQRCLGPLRDWMPPTPHAL